MKVTVDYQAAIGKKSGVGQYVYHLVKNMQPFLEKMNLNISFFDFNRAGKNISKPAGVHLQRSQLPGKVLFGLWKYVSFPDYGWIFRNADLYHFPNFVIRPVKRGKKIVTIHDLSFLRLPHFGEEKNIRFLTSQLNKTLERADAVIVDSYFTKSEMTKLTSYDEKKIYPIHLGVNERIRRITDKQYLKTIRTQYNLPDKYILFLGNIEPRKNLELLLKAYDKWNNNQYHLVLAGMYGWKYESIVKCWENLKTKERIHFLGFVGEEDKAALYSMSSAFVFPSFYEGFGFPPLEAMLCDIPVIASSAESLSEVLQDNALFFDPSESEQLENRLEMLIKNNFQISDLLKAREHAMCYQWQKTAARTFKVYQDVMKGVT